MTGKDQPPAGSEAAGHGRSQLDPEIEHTGRHGPVDEGGARGGALTGETGSLTGDDDEEPFVPGELREIGDPMHAREMTAASEHASDAHREELSSEHRDAGREGAGEGSEAPVPGAGPRATAAASGMGQLQGQATSLGGSGEVRPRSSGDSGPTEMATREGGYGTSHGLREDDPAYRVEDDENVPEAGGRQQQPDRF